MKFLLSLVISALAITAPSSATFAKLALIGALKSGGIGSSGPGGPSVSGNSYGYGGGQPFRSGYPGYQSQSGYNGLYNNDIDVKVIKVLSYPSGHQSSYGYGNGFSTYGPPTPVITGPGASPPIIDPTPITVVPTPIINTYQSTGLGGGYGAGYGIGQYGYGSGYNYGNGYGISAPQGWLGNFGRSLGKKWC